MSVYIIIKKKCRKPRYWNFKIEYHMGKMSMLNENVKIINIVIKFKRKLLRNVSANVYHFKLNVF